MRIGDRKCEKCSDTRMRILACSCANRNGLALSVTFFAFHASATFLIVWLAVEGDAHLSICLDVHFEVTVAFEEVIQSLK